MTIKPLYFARTRLGVVVRESDYKRKRDAVNAARDLSRIYGQEVTLKCAAKKSGRKLVLKIVA